MICWHACRTAAPQQPTVPGAVRVLGDSLFLRNQRNHFVEYNFESHHKVVGEVKDTKPKSSLLGTKRLHTLLPALQSWFKRWKALIFKGCRRNASRALAIRGLLYVPPLSLQMPIASYEGECIEFICAGMPAASQSPTKLLRTACLSSEINHIN